MYAAQINDFGSVGSKLKSGVKAVGKGAKAVGKGVAKGAKTVGKGAVKVAKLHVKLALLPTKLLIQYVGAPALKLALTPVRNSINTITTRRARKLAWDKRRSLQPTPAETKEAKSWTRAHLKAKGPHGRLVAAIATLAGAPPTEDRNLICTSGGCFGTSTGQLGLEPATTTLIIASIPVAVAIVNATARKLDKPNDAPKDPRGAAPTPAEQAAAEAEYERLVQADAAADREAGIGATWSKLPLWAKIAIPAGGLLTLGGVIYLVARPSDDTTVVAGGWGRYPAR